MSRWSPADTRVPARADQPTPVWISRKSGDTLAGYFLPAAEGGRFVDSDGQSIDDAVQWMPRNASVPKKASSAASYLAYLISRY